MVTMSVYQEIQRCKRVGYNKKQTAYRTGLARGTVRKFWDMNEDVFAHFRISGSQRRQRFDEFRDEIIALLEQNYADGQDVYASSVYDVLEERHGELPAGSRTLRNYIRRLHAIGSVTKTPKPRVRRPQEEAEPGDQCQVDFGQQRIGSGAVVYIFAAVLAASRVRFVSVQDHPFRTIDVIRHILSAFAMFGGRPRKLVIDQDRLMTVSENGGEIVHTTDFQAFINEQELAIWLCRKADPESKGKVENTVKFVKTSFFSARRFMTVEEIHEPLSQWLIRRANGKIHQATGRIPAVVLEREEAAALRVLRASVYDTSSAAVRDTRKADAKGMISFAGNRYSVPDEYAGEVVAFSPTATHLNVHDRETGNRIAHHEIPLEKGRTIVSTQHRAPRGKTAKEAYAELAKRIPDAQWHRFLEANHEAYPRYWKEQTALLKKVLEQSVNEQALVEAIAFCLESDSFGAGDLRYAMRHLEEAYLVAEQPLLEYVKPILAAKRTYTAPDVPRRGIGYYSSLVSLLGVAV